MNKKIGIIKSNDYLLHKPKETKLERPERLTKIYEYLELNSDKFCFYTPDLYSDKNLYKIHSQLYLDQLKQYSQNEYYDYDKDTYLNNYSYYVASLASSGCCKLAEKIINDDISKGFALVRPPGHHAETGRAMGFCLLNNIGLTAKYLIDNYSLDRILIVDFDAHHGNGTQEIFYDDPKVLTISIHQNNLFPYSGGVEEIGIDNGEGFNINIPVHPFFGDEEFYFIFGNLVQQVTETFLPQIILVSAGFDGHQDDSSSDLNITNEGYSIITGFLNYFAQKFSNGKILYVLEGGYNIDTLTESTIACLEKLQEEIQKPPGFMPSERAKNIIKKLPKKIKTKWHI